ncbi:MAG: zf-HC2 domain-containing protein [Treponema sp.]|mgnify:CR=1 FL=1|nr:zf-HC2 domain-containing protein [Treponema sp.]
MYSCPTDDIHSIYLDNELSPAYIKDYEAHVKNCPSCTAKLEALKRVKSAFQKDSESIQLDEDFMEKSFERLQTKMNYAKNTENVHQFRIPADVSKWAVAAAAVVVAAIVPVRITTSARNQQPVNHVASIAPVARPQSVPTPVSQSVKVNGNFDYSADYAMPVGTSDMNARQKFRGGNPSHRFMPPRPPMQTQGLSSSLTNVDVLRPEFDEAKKISIKINVPGLDEENDTIEIKLPVNMIPDNLSE